LYSGGDEWNIGFAAHLPIDILADDVTEVAPRECKVNTRGTHSRDVVVFKVLRDEALVIRPPYLTQMSLTSLSLVESNSDTVDVDVGSLAGTQVETLRDDRLVVQNVRRPVFIVNKDIDYGGHGGGY